MLGCPQVGAHINKVAPQRHSRSALLPLLATFVVAAAIFAWLQAGTETICCGDFDGYYHLKWSSLLWQGLRTGDLPSFIWLPFTSLNAHGYADQHFLFHLLLIPFTWGGDLARGAKISAVLFASLAICACAWPLFRYEVRFRWVWLVGLLGSSSLFLYRMSMMRAQSLSLIFLMIGIVLLFERKYRLLAPLAFSYVWAYNLFVILGIFGFLWGVAGWLSGEGFEWRALGWTVVGIAAGLVLNPYFPNDLRLLIQHVSARGLQITSDQAIGAEWMPISSWLLLKSSFVAFALTIAGCIALGYAGARSGRLRRPVFLLLVSTSLLLATARSRRFAEYWPPTALLFAALAITSCETTPSQTEHTRNSNLAKRTRNATDSCLPSPRTVDATPQGRIAAALAGVLLIAATAYQVWVARQIVATSVGPSLYRGAAQWLVANVPPGEIIFNSAWEDFPKLFYYDDSHRYVSGLDPLYLEKGNPELSSLYARITNGEERQPAQLIRNTFHARYVFLSSVTPSQFRRFAMLNGEFENVYADTDCVILKIRDSK